MRSGKIWVALMLALALVLAASPVIALGEGGISVTIGQVSEVANLNPTLYPRTPDSNVQCLIFDGLIKPQPDLSFGPSLAESWDVSEDGKLYTFHLKKDVKWHDGEPFTAADAVFTFTSLADPTYVGGAESRVDSVVGSKEYREGAADSVSGIQAPDDYTVTFELSEPNAAFLGQLNMPVLPKHILGDVKPGEWEKADFNRSPIGTGKYKFVKWEAGQYIELSKNPDYSGEQPSIDTIYYRFGDVTTLTAALMNGEVDVVESIEPSEVELLETSGTAAAVTYPTLNMYYIGLNQLNKHLGDLKVRQAMSYALDKPTMIETVFGEYAFATDDIFPENHWSHSTDITSYPYDPAKAEALLQDAGYAKNASGVYEKDGAPLHLIFDMVTKGQAQADMAQLIQQYFKAVGIEMEIREQDFSTLAFTRLLPTDESGEGRAVTADDFDMYTLGFGVEVDPDEYRSYFVSASTPPSGMNFISYNNPKVDELFAKSITLTTLEDREACYHEIASVISQDIPWIPLYGNLSIAGVGSKVKNFAADFRGITYQIEKWTIE